MKRFLSTGIAIALLLGLAVLAMLARPGGAGALLRPARVAAALAQRGSSLSAALPAAAPEASYGWSAIALPLNVSGVTNADQVASYIDSAGNIKQVAKWDAAAQIWTIRTVGSPLGTPNFAVTTGMPLLVAATGAAPTTFAWVGDVPDQGTVHNTLAPSMWNYIMVPLDQGSISTADALAAAIGGVTKVARWDATAQIWVIRTVGSPLGTPNFAVSIGYPYLILTGASSPAQWP